MNRRWSCVLVAVGTALASPGAHAQTSVDRALIADIKSEALERPQVERLFLTLTDAIGARLTGSPEYRRAAEWARDELAALGLANARLEAFEFGPGWSLEKLALEMEAPRYMPLIGIANAWSPSTEGLIRGEALYLGDMAPEEIQAISERVRGAIVLIDPVQTRFPRRDRVQPTLVDGPVRSGAPFMPSTREGARRNGFNAFELGAMEPAVVLSSGGGEHGTVFVGAVRPIEIPLQDGDTLRSVPVPSATLAAEHYNMLARMAAEGESVALSVEIRSVFHDEDLNSYNVFADLPGTDPELADEIVLIGAHLDSWHGGVGATDNADAVVAVMEAMRILKAVDARPRRTIRAALWGGEEQGLLGSQAHVERHLADPAARDRISVYLNDDPGTGPTYGFFMEENPGAKAVFDEWLTTLEDVGVRRNVFEGIGGTDHQPFDRVGIPAFTAIKEYTDYDTRTHHTNADLAERVRPADLTQSAIVLATMAWLASVSDEIVPRRPPEEATAGRFGLSIGSVSSGEPIEGARVRIEGTAHRGLSNERGELVLEDVAGERATVVVEHPDYQTWRRENFQIRVDRLRFLNVWLEPR